MVGQRILLWNPNEYSYPMAFGFVPNLVSYIHEEPGVYPCMIVVPGGGYCLVSPSEGEIVAKKFYNKGYNVFVLTYTTNILMMEPLKLQPLKDISRAVRLVRAGAARYRIDPDRVVLCGFSAGGHLCASLCVHYEDIHENDRIYARFSNRPDAAILSYPVITSGEKAHRGSFTALFGEDASVEELDYMSLEKHVDEATPPCFLWQTRDDQTVPVENSYLFAKACREHDVCYAHHVFSEGAHGLSLANEEWSEGKYGIPYTLEQTRLILDKLKAGELELSKEKREQFMQEFCGLIDKSPEELAQESAGRQPNHEAAIWPEIAELWLKKVL